MQNFYTENLADFGYREIKMLRDTLDAWIENGLPDDFDNTGVKPAMNRNSGDVFLVNEEYQVAMLNGDKLETFHSLPYSGNEGFLSDLVNEYNPDDLNSDDVEYILNAGDITGFDFQPPWLDLKIDRTLDMN
ncbi:MAG: hypothetical protein V4561_10155 [Bacteroidota bacterium]